MHDFMQAMAVNLISNHVRPLFISGITHHQNNMQVEFMLITSPDDRDLGQLCFEIAPARAFAMIRVDLLVPQHDQSCVAPTQRHT